MANQYLVTLPAVRYIVDKRLDEKGQPVIDDQKRMVVDVREIVHPLRAYEMALQTITSGPKLFEVWALRKRIKEAQIPDRPLESAKYLVISEDEKSLILEGFKTVDWTLKQSSPFWVEWEALFDSVRDIAVFDEKNPPVGYVEWRQVWEKQQAEIESARKEAERKAIAEAEAAKIKRTSTIKKLADALLSLVLSDRVAAGKLGSAATIDDLPADVIANAVAEATQTYDANPAQFDEAAQQTAEPATTTENEAEITADAPADNGGVVEAEFTPAK